MKKNTRSQLRMNTSNMMEYSHFLAQSNTNSKQLQWMSQLRLKKPSLLHNKSNSRYKNIYLNSNDNQQNQNIKSKSIQPPSTYFKQRSKNNIHRTSDLTNNCSMAQISHLLMYRSGNKADVNLVNFEINLRREQNQDPKLLQKQKKWTNLPKKDRNEPPAFLPRMYIKRMKDINPQQLQNGLDGRNNYPLYNQKKIQERNYQTIRHLCKGEVDISRIQWQTSLRTYTQN